MKLSIVVPIYKVEQFLDQCVESVLQLKTDFELILVDDGSPDRCGELCDEWAEKDQRIKVVHQENGGLSAARNTGIRESSGEWIMFIDSDDFIDSVETDRMLEQLDVETDALVGLYQNYYADQGIKQKEACEELLSLHGKVAIDEFLATIPKTGEGCYMVAVRFVIKRSFLIENELFFMKGIYHEDEEWTQRMLCKAKHIFVTHTYFYYYRQEREGAITFQVRPKHIWDTFTIMEHTEKLITHQTEKSSQKEYLQFRMAQLYLSNMMNLYILNDRDDKARAYALLKQYQEKCIPFMRGKAGLFAKCCYCIFGCCATCKILYAVRKLIGKIK